ncbi:hypothetical protein HMPREF1548_02254 [Clostridium sp. KLE 1755]|nr:hypothetical protein HMPREF1548_02254 [Clostridium sp. KLE 1755]
MLLFVCCFLSVASYLLLLICYFCLPFIKSYCNYTCPFGFQADIIKSIIFPQTLEQQITVPKTYRNEVYYP